MPDTNGQALGRRALVGLGSRIRRLRGDRELAAAELAERARVSQSYLDEVESGETVPPLDVLAQIATVLGVPLAELFTDTKPGPAAVVLRSDEVPAKESGGLTVQVLTPRAVVPGLYAARYRLEADREHVELAPHDGHDWLYVLAGALRVDFEQDSATLRPDDSVSFAANVPHWLSAAGEEPTEFLAVGCTLLDHARRES